MRDTVAFVQQVSKLAQAGRIVSEPPRSIERMASCPSRDDARKELSEVGHNVFEAWALGLTQAAKRYPQVFGVVDDPLAWQHRLDELRARRVALFARIGREFEPDDIALGHIFDDGRCLVTFMLSNGAVALGSIDSAGERLVNYLLSIDPQRWGEKQEVQAPVQKAKATVGAPQIL